MFHPDNLLCHHSTIQTFTKEEKLFTLVDGICIVNEHTKYVINN